MKVLALRFAVAALAFAFTPGSVQAAPPAPLADMDQALKVAAQHNKCAFIMVGTRTCSHCGSLRKRIRSGELPVTDDKFVWADLDFKDPGMWVAFRKRFPNEKFVGTLPDVIIADPRGNVLTSYNGAKRTPKLTKIIEGALAKRR